MKKSALGSCMTIERETTPLRKMMDGIRFLFTSRSDRSSGASDRVFDRSSNDASGEICAASPVSSQAGSDCGAESWLASETPAPTEVISVSSGAGAGAGVGASLSVSWLCADGLRSTGGQLSYFAAESQELSVTSSLVSSATSCSEAWVTVGAETQAAGRSSSSSTQGWLAVFSVDLSSPVGCRFVSVLGACMQEASEGGISSRSAWEPSDLSFDSCCRDGSGAEGLLSMGCSDVWLPNSLWSLGKGCDLFGWTDSLAQRTKDELVWSVVSEDVQGSRSPGDTVWADSVPSADGSSRLGGTEGPDGGTAIC